MKFSEVKVGQEFDIHGITAVKLDKRGYRVTSSKRHGYVMRTSANANVNGLSGDKAHAVKQKSDRVRLNEIAQSVGYDNWSALGRAAIRGAEIHINKPHPHQKAFDLTAGLSEKSNYSLFISAPISVGGDSVDVEQWITEHWHDGEITDENYQIVAERFISWYRDEE